jgi:hypothetical protein
VNPNASGSVNALAVSRSTVYAGRTFQHRRSVARATLQHQCLTGAATALQTIGQQRVLALAVNGSTVYVGGSFTFIGGQSYPFVAALDASTGAPASWRRPKSTGSGPWR